MNQKGKEKIPQAGQTNATDKQQLKLALTVSSNAMLGASAMVAGIALLSGMDAVVKILVTQDVSVLHILAIRSWLIVIVMLLFYVIRGQTNQLKPVRKLHQAVRSVFGIVAPLLFFLGLKYLPLTDSVVIFFTSTLAVTFLSAIILGERVGVHRWAAVGIGYIGVLIAMRPSGEGQLIGYALAFGGSLAYAYLFLSGRYLSQTETVSSLVFYYNLGVGVTSSLWIVFIARELLFVPSASVLTGITAIAVLAVCGHYLMTLAFAKAEVSLIAPLEYTAIIWAIGLDYLLWQIAPLPTTLLGAAIIIGSGYYVMHREQLKKSEIATTPSG